jgi:F0F1-type ATP synthase delta subunit
MIKEQKIKKEDTTFLKDKEKREITFQGRTATFQYIECGYEEASLLYSLIQNTSLKVAEEISKFNLESSNEFLGAKIITALKCTKEGREALSNCLKKCFLNDLAYEYAMQIRENWGFGNACEMLVIDAIINTFQDF